VFYVVPLDWNPTPSLRSKSCGSSAGCKVGETWSHGKPLTPSRLARLLRGYSIVPDSIRIGEKTPKGYERGDFRDAFPRYLRIVDTPLPQSATTPQTTADACSGGFSRRNTEAPVAGPERQILNEMALVAVLRLCNVQQRRATRELKRIYERRYGLM